MTAVRLPTFSVPFKFQAQSPTFSILPFIYSRPYGFYAEENQLKCIQVASSRKDSNSKGQDPYLGFGMGEVSTWLKLAIVNDGKQSTTLN